MKGTRLISLFSKQHLRPSPHSQFRFFNSSSSSASSNKLFVGGLSWSVDEKSLKDAFSSFGDVTEVRIVYDKDSGRARGFGFVIFSNEDAAKSAKDAMDGKALLGRPLRINFALEKPRGIPVVVPRFTDNGHFNRSPKSKVLRRELMAAADEKQMACPLRGIMAP